MSKSLSPVINVDADRCVNCHACIGACPVKYCMDGSGSTIKINHDRCIGCGSCISACTHGARTGIDDFAAFTSSLSSGQKVVAVVAPSVASSFPDQYLQVNGLLTSMGVAAVFDVSFGAELTVKSYLDHVVRNKPDMVIAQPCPAIVGFIETWAPQLLPHLAPADSPMMHTIKMIKQFYPEHKTSKVAIISPCYAKRREFDAVGMGDFNVTIKSINLHLEKTGQSLSKFKQVEYANPPAERAVLFSTPGGLMRTVERENPGVLPRIRKIEGPHTIYRYLELLPNSLKNGTNPLIVDCLNCELGCNGGPGTLNQDKSPDETEAPVERRRVDMQKRYGKPGDRPDKARKSIAKVLSKYWKPGIYARSYEDRSSYALLPNPSATQEKEIEARMNKHEEKDFYNCTACGYGTCKAMVKAIYLGLNKPENCHYYLASQSEADRNRMTALGTELDKEIQASLSLLELTIEAMGHLDTSSQNQVSALEESSAAIEEMIASIHNSSRISEERRKSIEDLVRVAKLGEEQMRNTGAAIGGISESIKSIKQLTDVINGVASHTNMLSMNAAIEAAHAGSSGRGFAVVAEEIRRLAETTSKNAKQISGTLKAIVGRVGETSTLSTQSVTGMNNIITDIHSVSGSIVELINALSEMSTGGSEITSALSDLRNQSSTVNNLYTTIRQHLTKLASGMRDIGDISRENIQMMQRGHQTG